MAQARVVWQGRQWWPERGDRFAGVGFFICVEWVPDWIQNTELETNPAHHCPVQAAVQSAVPVQRRGSCSLPHRCRWGTTPTPPSALPGTCCRPPAVQNGTCAPVLHRCAGAEGPLAAPAAHLPERVRSRPARAPGRKYRWPAPPRTCPHALAGGPHVRRALQRPHGDEARHSAPDPPRPARPRRPGGPPATALWPPQRRVAWAAAPPGWPGRKTAVQNSARSD